MKKIIASAFSRMLAFSLLLLVLGACKKNDFAYLLPVEGGPVLGEVIGTSLAHNTAGFSVTITSTGDSPITAKGICWGRSPNPTINDSKTNVGAGASPFSTSATGLKTDTLYYVRAYATNSQGTNYGETIEITPPERVVPPCSLVDRYFNIGSSSRYMGVAEVTYNSWSNYQYHFQAYYYPWSSSYDYLRFKFKDRPVTGKYVTIPEGSSLGTRTCIVNADVSYTEYDSFGGDTVYVEKIGIDRYSMTICNARVTRTGNPTVYRLTSKISN